MSTLPSTHQDASQSVPQQTDRTSQMTIRSVGYLDKQYVDVAAPPAKAPRPSGAHVTSGLMHETWVDIDPQTAVSWGQDAKFAFGLEGHSEVTAVEVHFDLSAITQATVPGQRRFVWPEWCAELLCRGNGNDSSIIAKYMQNNIARIFVDSYHMRKRIEANVDSIYDSFYRDAVGSETENAQHVFLPLDIPGISSQDPLVALQLTEPISLQFTIPAWQDVVTTSNSNPTLTAAAITDNVNGVTADPTVKVWLRVHYADCAQPQRVAMTDEVVRKGLSTKCYYDDQLTVDVPATTATTAADGQSSITAQVDLSGFLGPLYALVLGVRENPDLQRVTAYAGGAVALGTTENPSPKKYRFVPWQSVELVERNSTQRVYPELAFRQNSSYHAKMGVNSPILQNLCTITNTPLVQRSKSNSLGHISPTNMQAPRANLTFRKTAFVSDDSSSVFASSDRIESDFDPATINTAAAYTAIPKNYTLTATAMMHNTLHMVGGRIYRNHE